MSEIQEEIILSESDRFFNDHHIYETTRPGELHGVRIETVMMDINKDFHKNGIHYQTWFNARSRAVREKTGAVLIDTKTMTILKAKNTIERFVTQQVTLDAILYGIILDTNL